MNFSVPAEQVGIMFALIALGWVAYRVGWFGQSAVKGMTNLLLNLVAPAVILDSFQRPFVLEELRSIGIVFLVDVAAFGLMLTMAWAIFNRRVVPDPNKRVALQFGTVYSNAGFIGIPLTYALLGNDGVLYAVTFIAAFTIFIWTHGLALFGSVDEPPLARLKRLILNPGILATIISLTLYVSSISLPEPVMSVVGYVGSMNTPLSMIVVGGSLATFSLRSILGEPLAWLGALARNIVVPAVFIVLLGLLPIDPVARVAILVSVSAPVGASIVIFSLRFDRSPRFGTTLLCISTLLSIITIPVILVAATAWWG